MPSTLSPDATTAALTQLDRLTVTEILALWKLLEPNRLQRSFENVVMPGALLALVTAQEAAATIGGRSVDTDALIDPLTFAGLAADGYELPSKLAQPLIGTYRLLSAGVPMRRALAVGAARMDQVVTTEIHDVARSAEQVAITAERTYTGWVRQIEPGACSRCIILAGRVYRWNEGFKRHPKCRCHHSQTQLPVGQPSDDPKTYFDGLTRAEQDRTFTPDTAEAIRLGGDMNQLVNARLGMTEVTTRSSGRFGPGTGITEVQTQKITTQGTAKRSWYSYQQRAIGELDGISATGPRGKLRAIDRPRLLPEEIFKEAGNNRAKAITMLTENGYIVGDLQAQARRVVAARSVSLN